MKVIKTVFYFVRLSFIHHHNIISVNIDDYSIINNLQYIFILNSLQTQILNFIPRKYISNTLCLTSFDNNHKSYLQNSFYVSGAIPNEPMIVHMTVRLTQTKLLNPPMRSQRHPHLPTNQETVFRLAAQLTVRQLDGLTIQNSSPNRGN